MAVPANSCVICQLASHAAASENRRLSDPKYLPGDLYQGVTEIAPDPVSAVRYSGSQNNLGCRRPASLAWPISGPGGRHVSSNSSHCIPGFDSFCLRPLLRRLLPLRGLYGTGAGLLQRLLLFLRPWLLRAALLPACAAVLPFSSAVLPTNSAVLPAAALPTGAALLPVGTAGRLPRLSEPWLGWPAPWLEQ